VGIYIILGKILNNNIHLRNEISRKF